MVVYVMFQDKNNSDVQFNSMFHNGSICGVPRQEQLVYSIQFNVSQW